MRYVFGFLCVCALGVAPVVGCIVSETNPCGNCDDGNPCTLDSCGKRCLSPFGCYEWVFECKYSSVTDGTPCGSGNVCVDGGCGENLCEGVDCDDGNPCTHNYCDYEDRECDSDPSNGALCEADGLSGICMWDVCEVGDPCTADDLFEERCNPVEGVWIQECLKAGTAEEHVYQWVNVWQCDLVCHQDPGGTPYCD